MRIPRLVIVVTILLLSVGLPSAAAPVGPQASETAGGTPTVDASTTAENANTTTEQSTTTTASAENDTFAPGVNRSGVEDPSALVAAHRSSLNDTGFSFEFRANVSVGTASQRTVQCGTVAPGVSPLVVHSESVREFDGDATTVATDLWVEENVVVAQHSRENRTEIRRYNRTGGNVGVPDETWAHLPRADIDSQVTHAWLIELALSVGEYDLVRTERRNGSQVAVLRATEPVAAANFTDLDATVVVDEEGRVHSLSLTATAEGDDPTRIHYEFELTEVGSVEVERPEWAEAAIPPNETAENATAEGPYTAFETLTTAAAGDET